MIIFKSNMLHAGSEMDGTMVARGVDGGVHGEKISIGAHSYLGVNLDSEHHRKGTFTVLIESPWPKIKPEGVWLDERGRMVSASMLEMEREERQRALEESLGDGLSPAERLNMLTGIPAESEALMMSIVTADEAHEAMMMRLAVEQSLESAKNEQKKKEAEQEDEKNQEAVEQSLRSATYNETVSDAQYMSLVNKPCDGEEEAFNGEDIASMLNAHVSYGDEQELYEAEVFLRNHVDDPYAPRLMELRKVGLSQFAYILRLAAANLWRHPYSDVVVSMWTVLLKTIMRRCSFMRFSLLNEETSLMRKGIFVGDEKREGSRCPEMRCHGAR